MGLRSLISSCAKDAPRLAAGSFTFQFVYKVSTFLTRIPDLPEVEGLDYYWNAICYRL
jgi:hypothetical protein